ncbi:regulator [Herbidospora sp. NEAU-GS84]|uniref:Regulator n=1 Tax=Herbidospora solisilvae TaxID=2696284 RepID=A0A7C9NKI1_9ACTN|nr:regulator [Herbidospora solisilvae]NAS25478.1 regulator [Herbidospora solisilvae]
MRAEVTSFIGREPEITEIARLLEVSRLVTLTGVGGVGKSRLASRVAAVAQAGFPGGVFVADLAKVGEPDLLAVAVADAMRLTDRTARPADEVLTAHLADRRALLVLDGADRLVDACAKLAELLLRGAPGLRVLVTSRQPLDVAGEHLFAVAPMNRTEALELLADRAGRVVADDAGLCDRLDGIPLAIELAAVRLAEFPVEELVRRLDDRFRLLDGLRAAIGLSHELCSPAERLLWARLSVFAGSFGLAAAEEVCADRTLPAHALLGLISGLVDRSIVVRAGGQYRLLDTVRDYGEEWLHRLGPDETDRLRRKHKNHYLRLARRGESQWFGPGQQKIYARTHAEHGNFRAALEFCVSTPGEERDGLDLAATLWFYWVCCGHLGEGRHWLEQVLDSDPSPTPERAKALWVAGYVAIMMGDTARATALLAECRERGDDRSRARAVQRLGALAMLADELDRAIPLLLHALAEYEDMGLLDTHVLMGKIELAMAQAFTGRLEPAGVICRDVRRLCEDHGERWVLAYVCYVEAYLAWGSGDHAGAERLVRESLTYSRVFNDLIGTVLDVELLALVLVGTGDAAGGALLQGAAAVVWESVGSPLYGSRHFTAAHEECARKAALELGEEAYQTALARGRRMGLDRALEISTRGRELSTSAPQT